MIAGDLHEGFLVGGCRVEPRLNRVSSADRSVDVDPAHMRVLLCLAARHGEAVDRRELRRHGWPEQGGSDERLREAIVALREAFADKPRHPRYIAPVGHDAYALVAHFEPVERPPEPSTTESPVVESRLAVRVNRLFGELRRRHVFRVVASYLLVMWIVLQVAQVTFAPLRFPDWWMTALTLIAVLGLPIVIALAWTYEITPAGLVVDAGSTSGAVKLPRARLVVAPFVVAGVALMTGVTGLAWWRSIQLTPAPGQRAPSGTPAVAKSIAVLPLVDMSPAGGNDFLGDGLSEELSTRLAQVAGLRVAARTSAFEFKGRNVDVRQIGEALGVRHVLEGSVRREGDTVRVTVQLIDTQTGYHVWAGNFDRAWSQVLALQDDIAQAVTNALQIVLTANAADEASGSNEVLDVRAIEPYLQGLASLRRPSDLSVLRDAEKSFEAAVGVAPSFAAAHAGLCRTRVRLYEQTRNRGALAAAETSCKRSLELGPRLVEARRALAALYQSDGKLDAATATYRDLLRINPQDADAHVGLGQTLAAVGRNAEAETSLRRAVAIDPAYWNSHAALGGFLFARGRAEEAEVVLRKVTELAPASASAWSNLGAAAQLRGDMATAVKAFEKSLQLEPSKDAYSNLATVQYYTGSFPESVRNYERALSLGEHDQIIRGNLADALWQIDSRRPEAVRLYRRAIELGETELASTPTDATLRAQMGYYYGRVGEVARARAYIDEAVAAAPDLIYVQYYRAVAAADRGDRSAALEAVAQLLKSGYPRALLRLAPEFQGLARDPEYVRMMQDG
jgi:TolB-like protein/Flp pilus assembly protein TadD/DNA-binding winged helix-turn-helix (wHTH) protein